MTTTEMTYGESAKGIKISQKRAELEMRNHGITDLSDVAEGLAYAKRGESYSASLLLEWLGY